MSFTPEWLLQNIAESAGKPVAIDQTFADAGLDSLDYLWVIQGLELACDVEFPRAVAARFETPADVLAWLVGWASPLPGTA